MHLPIRNDIPTERLGTPYGGWIIPANTLNSDSVCYLVGAGEDISFDVALAGRYGCPVHIFDPTPRAIAHVELVISKIALQQPVACATSPGGFYPETPAPVSALLHLHPYGIWSEDTTLRFFAPQNEDHVSHSLVNLQQSEASIEVPVRRLATLREELGHRHIDLLKIDTEGAEYQILESILADQLPIDILCIEFDESASNHIDRHYIRRIRQCLENLMAAGYEIIAKEPDSRNYTLVHRRRLAQ